MLNICFLAYINVELWRKISKSRRHLELGMTIPNIQSLYSQVWFGIESSVGEEFALHADICNLGSGFLATNCI